MEYQEFLAITDATQDKVSEEFFTTQIGPVIQDRQDLFPSFSAVSRHYSHFGLNGFSDAFIEAWDALVDAIGAVREATGDNQGVLKEVIVSSLYRSHWAF